VNITQPAAIAKYNRCMRGTDRMDHNLNLYRISIRSKKWWWGLFAFCVDVALCNAWYLHRCGPRENRNQLSLLDFRREIANTYIMKFSSRQAVGRPLGTVGRHRPLDVCSPADVHFDVMFMYPYRPNNEASTTNTPSIEFGGLIYPPNFSYSFVIIINAIS